MTCSGPEPIPQLEKTRSASGGLPLVALFVVYLVLLSWVVLWKLEVPYVGGGALRRIKLVPFAPTAEAGCMYADPTHDPRMRQ